MKDVRIRRHRRVEFDVFVNKIVGDQPHLARARDISISGIYLQKLIEPAVDSDGMIGLEMMLPGSDQVIWALGRVVREIDGTGDGVAVSFERIAESDREQIRRFISEAHMQQAA